MTPDDPLTAKINREGVGGLLGGRDHENRGGPPHLRSRCARIHPAAIRHRPAVGKIFRDSTKTFDKTRISTRPGLAGRGFARMAERRPRAQSRKHRPKSGPEPAAPTLAEVTGWQRAERRPPAGTLAALLLLLPGRQPDHVRTQAGPIFSNGSPRLSGPNPASAQFLFPTEAGWQRELAEATQRSRDIVYSWDETVAELAAAEVIAIPADKPSDTRILHVRYGRPFPANPA
jgi:hypothetical protein